MIYIVSYWWAFLLGVLLYWLPTGVARWRRASSWVTIAWFNFLLGWTILGWFGTLVWAITAQPLRRGRRISSPVFEKPEYWEPFMLQRALELADMGQSLGEIREKLKKEGYDPASLSNATVTEQLSKRILAAKGAT